MAHLGNLERIVSKVREQKAEVDRVTAPLQMELQQCQR